jgi:hypothetical protein
MDQMKAMMGRMQDSNEMQDMGPPGESNSPIDRLEALAKHMSEQGAAMLSVAKAAEPLYASLDDSQKRLFRLLDGETLMMGHGHHGMGTMGGMGEGMMGGTEMMGQGGMGMGMMGGGRGMMGEGGMGMTGREPDGMMGNSWNGDEETDQE